ncbi:MAG: hypothetical protein KH315_02265 [Faecalibacterium prausnitzii]|uniref:Uncharacterized protein n=1 Tax=Faecalibacterium prausnitzii TaxID=853 RepID=A0A9E1GIH8_9FIRM|nr:hypothetical protein [Faecalibacterium prausnitzii]
MQFADVACALKTQTAIIYHRQMNCKYLCLSLPSPALFVNGDSKEKRPWPNAIITSQEISATAPFDEAYFSLAA